MKKTITLIFISIFFVMGCSIVDSEETEYDRILKKECLRCHDSSKWKNRNFTELEWEAILDRMAERGARIDAENRKVLLHGWKY